MAGGLGGLIVTLGLNAVEFFAGLTKAEQQTKNLVEATKKQSAAIDRQIKSLQHQAATIGLTTRELKLYELAQKGATAGQLAQAGAALRTVENFDRMQKAARGLGVALGTLGVGSILGIVALGKSVLDGIDALDDLKDATGSSIENISALEDVARRAGEGFEVVETALVRMNKVLNDTEDGKKAANIIKGLGLEIQTLRALDPAEAMRQLAVAFSRFADDGAKGRAFLELFNKSAKDIAPFLADLAKQTQLVGTVTAEQAAEVKKFREQMFALEKTVLDLARAMAGPLLASTQKFIADLIEITKASDGAFAALNKLVKLGSTPTTGAAANSVLNFFGINQTDEQKIEDLRKKIAGLGDSTKNAFGVQQLKKYQAELDALVEKARFASRAIGTLNPETGIAQDPRLRRTPSLGDFKDDEKAKKIAKTVSEAQRYLETLQKQGEKTQELSVLEQTLLDIQKGRIEGLTPKLKEQIIVAAKEVDARKQTVDMLKSEQTAREAVAKMVQAASAAAAAETAQLVSSNEALRLEIEMLGADEVARAAINNARDESLITLKEEELAMLKNADAIGVQTRELEAQIAVIKERQSLRTKKADIENFQGVQKNAEESFEKFKKETEQMSEFAKRASENIQDALGDTLLRSLKGDFKSIAQLWSDLILKMIAQAAAAQLNEHLFGKTGLGGLLGPALNAAFGGGGDTGYGSVPGGGGPGMNNPSAFEASASAESRAMAQSIVKVPAPSPSLVQNINIGDYATRNDVMNAMTVAKEQAKAEILQLQRNGQFQNA